MTSSRCPPVPAPRPSPLPPRALGRRPRRPQPRRALTAAPSSPAAADASSTTYVVKSGDALAGIAWKHGVKLGALVKANNLTVASMIYPGQTLTIPPATMTIPVPTAAPVVQTPAAASPAAAPRSDLGRGDHAGPQRIDRDRAHVPAGPGRCAVQVLQRRTRRLRLLGPRRRRVEADRRQPPAPEPGAVGERHSGRLADEPDPARRPRVHLGPRRRGPHHPRRDRAVATAPGSRRSGPVARSPSARCRRTPRSSPSAASPERISGRSP